TMRVALRSLQPRYPDRILSGASYWDLCEKEWSQHALGPRKGMGHACEFETAMIMHLRPKLVRTDRIRDDHRPLPDSLRGLTLARDFSQMTEPGAIGYPSKASPESGRKFLQIAIDRTHEVCQGLLTFDIPAGRVRRTLD
ncbi:creatininase family protein, partial [bacterium]|nr:creatininase family protein [bacterium]